MFSINRQKLLVKFYSFFSSTASFLELWSLPPKSEYQNINTSIHLDLENQDDLRKASWSIVKFQALLQELCQTFFHDITSTLVGMLQSMQLIKVSRYPGSSSLDQNASPTKFPPCGSCTKTWVGQKTPTITHGQNWTLSFAYRKQSDWLRYCNSRYHSLGCSLLDTIFFSIDYFVSHRQSFFTLHGRLSKPRILYYIVSKQK